MSLLNRGTDQVIVYPEVVVTDSDGNKITKPGSTGVVCRAVVQPLQPPMASSVAEDPASRYRLRLVGYTDLLGAQSAVEWGGKRYAILGDPLVYNGSRRTAHVEYTMVRR